MKDAFKLGNTSIGLVAGAGIGFIIGETSIKHRGWKMIIFPIIGAIVGNFSEVKIQNKIQMAYSQQSDVPNPNA